MADGLGQVPEQRSRSEEQEQNTPTIKQELTACLVHGNGHVVSLPTDDLLAALDRLQAGSRIQEHRSSSNREAIYAFLQTLKSVMQACKALPAES
jgi:hypothetical protein